MSQVSVKSILKALNTPTSTGSNSIAAKLLCAIADQLADPISKLLNEPIKQSPLSNLLKEAEVSPIYK